MACHKTRSKALKMRSICHYLLVMAVTGPFNAAAATTFDELVRTGDPVPQSNDTFTFVRDFIFQPDGDIVFAHNTGVYQASPDAVTPLVRIGDAAPGAPSGGGFTSLGNFAINDEKTILFVGRTGDPSFRGLWQMPPDGEPELFTPPLIQNDEGQFTGGLSGVSGITGKAFERLVLSPRAVALNNLGAFVVTAGPNGVFRGTATTLQNLFFTRDPSPSAASGLPVSSLAIAINEAGVIYVHGGQQVGDIHTLWRDRNGTFEFLIQDGSPAPGLAGRSINGIEHGILIGTGDRYALRAEANAEDQPTTVGLWAGTTAADLRLLVQTRVPTPTDRGEVVFNTIQEPVYGADGRLYFISTGIVGDQYDIISLWQVAPLTGEIRAMGSPAGPFLEARALIGVNQSGQIAYANWTDTQDGTLWIRSAAGLVNKVVAVGDSINGQAITQLIFGRKAAAGKMAFNDAGQLAFVAGFAPSSGRLINAAEGLFVATLDKPTVDTADFVWSGDCGTRNWHAPCGETNWNDKGSGDNADRIPGTGGTDRVEIKDAQVRLVDAPVTVYGLDASGTLEVEQTLTVENAATIDKMTLKADLITRGAVEVAGDAVQESGTIKLQGARGKLTLNTGTIYEMQDGLIEDDGTGVRLVNEAFNFKKTGPGTATLNAHFENTANARVTVQEGTLAFKDQSLWRGHLDLLDQATAEFINLPVTLDGLSAAGAGLIHFSGVDVFLKKGSINRFEMAGPNAALAIDGMSSVSNAGTLLNHGNLLLGEGSFAAGLEHRGDLTKKEAGIQTLSGRVELAEKTADTVGPSQVLVETGQLHLTGELTLGRVNIHTQANAVFRIADTETPVQNTAKTLLEGAGQVVFDKTAVETTADIDNAMEIGSKGIEITGETVLSGSGTWINNGPMSFKDGVLDGMSIENKAGTEEVPGLIFEEPEAPANRRIDGILKNQHGSVIRQKATVTLDTRGRIENKGRYLIEGGANLVDIDLSPPPFPFRLFNTGQAEKTAALIKEGAGKAELLVNIEAAGFSRVVVKEGQLVLKRGGKFIRTEAGPQEFLLETDTQLHLGGDAAFAFSAGVSMAGLGTLIIDAPLTVEPASTDSFFSIDTPVEWRDGDITVGDKARIRVNSSSFVISGDEKKLNDSGLIHFADKGSLIIQPGTKAVQNAALTLSNNAVLTVLGEYQQHANLELPIGANLFIDGLYQLNADINSPSNSIGPAGSVFLKGKLVSQEKAKRTIGGGLFFSGIAGMHGSVRVQTEGILNIPITVNGQPVSTFPYGKWILEPKAAVKIGPAAALPDFYLLGRETEPVDLDLGPLATFNNLPHIKGGRDFVVSTGSKLTLHGVFPGDSFTTEGAFINHGTVVLKDGASIATGPDKEFEIREGSRLEGSGRINGRTVNNGVIAQGDSPGTITIAGDYTQTATGVLEVELGGTEPGVTYDQLIVEGTASFAEGAVINIKLLDPNPDNSANEHFLPDVGTRLDFLVADQVVVSEGADLGDVIVFDGLPLGLEFVPAFTTIDGKAVLQLETTVSDAAVLVGDFNGDRTVNLQDFFLFAEGFGKPAAGPVLALDLDRSGVIDFGDFFLFAENFGQDVEF